MINLFLTGLFLILFLIISLPIQFVLFLIEKAGRPDIKDHASLRIVQWGFGAIEFFSGTRVNVIGKENIPKDKAVLYIGNHNSFFDIVISYRRVPSLTGYVSKQEINKVPSLRVWMRYLHCLFLDRSDLKAGMKMLLDAVSLINNGVSVCIFPEGTRNTTGNEINMLPFKEGSFKIADKSGCLIVPMAITGTADIFENHFPWLKPCRVTLQYGTPIDPSTLEKADRKHLGKITQDAILAMIKEQKGIS